MQKLRLILAIAILATVAEAQQVPLYSNYFFTPYIYNPATSGSAGVTQATLLHRRQWSGVQGSPETSALAIDGSLDDKQVGWSAYGFNDKTDIISRVGIYGNYAYRIRFSDENTLALGMGAGYLNTQIDQSAIRAKDNNDLFSVVGSGRGTFDLTAGLNLEIGNFELGAAAPQLLSQNVVYAENQNPIYYNMIRHYVFNTSYDFEFGGDKQVLTPLVMVKAGENVPLQVDAGAMFNLTEYGYIGAMYRSEYAVTGNIGVNITDQLTVGYAYDFSLNEYGSSLGTSHEFRLTYRFGSNNKNERLENEIKRLKRRQRQQRDETEEVVDEKLEEFKDSFEPKQQEEQQQQQSENRQQSQNQQQGRDQQQGRHNQQQQGRSQQQGNRGQSQQQGGNQQQNQNSNYDAANQASNVSPGSKGYYVTAGVFSSESNAKQKQQTLQNKGFDARYFRDPSNNFYYVYLLKFGNYKQADQAKSSNMNGAYDGELWIKIVE